MKKSNWLSLFITVAIALSLLTVNAMAEQEPRPDSTELFQLYTHCQPVYAQILLSDRAVQLFEAKEQTLLVAVESRLRAARLYISQPPVQLYEHPSLAVKILLLRSTFTVKLELHRTLSNFIKNDDLINEWIQEQFSGWFKNRFRDREDVLKSKGEDDGPTIVLVPTVILGNGVRLPAVGSAVTWSEEVTAIYDVRLENATLIADIRNALSEMMDSFLADYLRINQPAC